jgi:WD40 repeat protein
VLPVTVDAHTEVDWLVPVGDGTAIVARRDASRTNNRQHPLEHVDLTSGRVVGTLGLGIDAWDAAVSPDRTRAVVSTASRGQTRGRLVVFDLATMRVRASIDKPGPATMDGGLWHGNAVWLDDRQLVAGSPSGRIFVWEPETGRVVQRINDPPVGTGDTAALRVTADRTTLVAAGINIQLMMGFDLRTGKQLWRHPQEVNGNIFVDDTAKVVWGQEPGSGSSRMFAFDLATGERIASELNGQHGTVCDVRVSPDGNTVALASCNEGTVALWALDGRTATGAPLRPAGWASAADLWSPDGRYVAVFRNEVPRSLEVVDVRTGSRRRAPRVAGWDHSNPFFRRDGILQGVDGDDRHVVEFDPAHGTTRDTGIVMPGTDEVAAAAEFPARHLTVYGLFDGNVVVVDTARDKIVRTIATGNGPIYGVGWNVDGSRVFSAGQFEHVEAYDVASGKKVATLPSAGANLVVSPDRTLMAVNAFNGAITFYDTRTLRRAGDPLTGGTAFTRAMQFTWDGRTLVTGGLDSTLRLFDVASRRQIGVSIPITSVGVAISPDDDEIAATTDRGVQRLSINPAALRRAACRLADRNLTNDEWRQYVGDSPRRLCAT